MALRWRPDGDYVPEVPATRRIMPFIMRTRTGSAVYWEHKVDTRRTTAFLHAFRERTGLRATILHLIIWATAQTLQARPRLNRFTAGGRLYQRRGIWISFSAKKEKSDEKPIVVVKRRIDPGWTFEEVVRNIEEGIGEGRSERRSSTDKELSLVFQFPAFIIGFFARVLMKLDHLGLLPGFVMENDPLFCSVFIANLGSIGMAPAFHHLFEYGNCPAFITVGRIHDEVVPGPDGTPVTRPLMTLRYTFDERIEDDLYCIMALEMLRRLVEDPDTAMNLRAAS
jgi:hypothetical protein